MNHNNIADEIVGLTPMEASKIVRENGFSFRIVQKDGERLETKLDCSLNCINVNVDDNEVSMVVNVG